jgi:GT2 family glycosyltransferase
VTGRQGDTVTLAYVHDSEVAHSWHDSIVNLLMLDVANEQRIMRGGYIAMRYGTGGIIAARNQVAERFLDGDSEWLFIVDTDMGFRPDTLEQLLAAADPVERPIVGGLCFAQREVQLDGMSGFRCQPRVTIFDWHDGNFAGVAEYPRDTLVRCAGTGSACILIHRSVIERLHADNGPTWYDRIRADNGNLIGEDLSFCLRAGAAGFPVHVHTGVKTSHLKRVWLAEEDFLAFSDTDAAAQARAVPA